MVKEESRFTRRVALQTAAGTVVASLFASVPLAQASATPPHLAAFTSIVGVFEQTPALRNHPNRRTSVDARPEILEELREALIATEVPAQLRGDVPAAQGYLKGLLDLCGSEDADQRARGVQAELALDFVLGAMAKESPWQISSHAVVTLT